MESETRTPLTPLDLCTLIAHETVALLNADAEAMDTATQLREGLVIFANANGLGKEANSLLAWIDWEMESAKQFIAVEKDLPPLIAPERLLPVPDTAAQLDALWMIFRTAVNCTWDQRHALFDAAMVLTEMDGLKDLLLTVKAPKAGALTAEILRAELEDVRTALQAQETGQLIQT